MEVCIAAIQNHYADLTKIERQIADYILANSERAVGMNVADLAEAAGTAGSAVIRLCKTLGYTGFSQFRLALARELAARPVSALPLLSEADTAREIAGKVFDSQHTNPAKYRRHAGFSRAGGAAERVRAGKPDLHLRNRNLRSHCGGRALPLPSAGLPSLVLFGYSVYGRGCAESETG